MATNLSDVTLIAAALIGAAADGDAQGTANILHHLEDQTLREVCAILAYDCAHYEELKAALAEYQAAHQEGQQ